MKAILSLFAALLLYSLSTGQTFENNNEWYVYNTSNSMLPNNSVSSVFVENKNSIWVGTFSGLAHFDVAKNYWIKFNEAKYVKGIAADLSNNVWAATSQDGLYVINLGPPTHKGIDNFNTSNSGLPDNSLSDIVVDANNNKWIGTWGSGLVKYDDSTWTVYNTQNSALPHDMIQDLFIDQNENIWIATFDNGIAKLKDTSWTLFNTDNSGLPNNDVLSIYVDQNDIVWIGTTNSLVKYDGYNWNVYCLSTVGFPFINVYGICTGTCKYVATSKGLAILDSANSWHLKEPYNSDIPSENVSCVQSAGNGYKWVGTNGGGLAVYSESGVTLGLDDTKDDFVNIKLYPNPVVSSIIIDCLLKDITTFKLSIYSTNGQQVGEAKEFSNYTGELKHTIDVSDLPKGYYFIKIQNKDFSIVKKFIKA